MCLENDAWREIWKLLPKILVLFIATNSTEYIRGLIAGMLQLIYLRKTEHPVYKQVRQDARVILEEDGEICHSILARSIQADSHRGEIELLDKRWRSIGLFREVFGNTEFLD